MMLKTNRTLFLFPIALLALLVASAFIPNWLIYLGTISMAKGLVVLGLILLMRTGLVSFGQGLYYCLGGYVVGIASQSFGIRDVALVFVLVTLAATALSSLLGLLLCRYRAIFFAMLTMAFSMILFGILVKSETLGSTDGFIIGPATLFGWQPEIETLGTWVFALAVLITMVAVLLMHLYFHSPMGYAGEAIRENEIRVEYLGVSPKRLIYIKYIAAAVLASLGGALTALASGHVDPEMAFWTTSGEFVFIALLGGTLHVAAPLIAAFLFEMIRTYAFELAPYTWQMILGAVLLLIIFFLPKGLWSLLPKRREQRM
jgi:ABC-type branched-subunit amino acid transport system permease subunit